jgi:hypothetical protein
LVIEKYANYVKVIAYNVKIIMAAARNLHLAASFMAITNEPLEAGM